MFPIMMDEPESMKVAPRAWQMLQDAWRGSPRTERRDVRARREQLSATMPSPLATLALGAAEPDSHPRG